jgi:hypothetical protein
MSSQFSGKYRLRDPVRGQVAGRRDGRQRGVEDRVAHDIVGRDVVFVHAAPPMRQDRRGSQLADQIADLAFDLLGRRQFAIAVRQHHRRRPHELCGCGHLGAALRDIAVGGQGRVACFAQRHVHDRRPVTRTGVLHHQRTGHVLRISRVRGNDHHMAGRKRGDVHFA